nr:MAG TPA: hypothetical protein [Caudoviricetes sp.]DAU02021.1 MAG TPA: hypothetical protein [Caudoviricetes sp.]
MEFFFYKFIPFFVLLAHVFPPLFFNGVKELVNCFKNA